MYHFEWQFVDFVCGNIDLRNDASLSRHHGFVNSCDWHTMQFLSEIINIRDDVFRQQFSGGFILSWHQLNAIVLSLETYRQS